MHTAKKNGRTEEDTNVSVRAPLRSTLAPGQEGKLDLEIIFEMWCTSTSLKEMQDRPPESYQDGKIETEYERRRRHELAVFLTDEQGKKLGEQEGEQLRMTATCNERRVRRTWTKSTWSPSMHECLKIALAAALAS